MAVEPRASPAGRMYGRGPKIEAVPEAPGGGAGGGAAAEPAPEPRRAAAKTDEGPEGEVMAGTDGIPAHHHQQHSEREQLHHKHQTELAAMHHRHQHEHLMRAMGHHHEKQAEMHERHHDERRALHTAHERELREMHDRHEEAGGERGKGPTGGIREKPEGKSGTEAGGERKAA